MYSDVEQGLASGINYIIVHISCVMGMVTVDEALATMR